ncbi:MAG: CoA ester lyase [Acidimicrobiia bacterium]
MRIRSLLFAPAVRPDLLAKFPRAGADGVVIDCEDATPPDAKDEGRNHARTLGAELAAAGQSVFIRVNAVDTSWFDADVADGIPVGACGILVPMVEALDQLDRVGEALAAVGHDALRVVAGLETAAGVAGAREFLDHRVVTAGYFGAEDFVADMGGVRTDSNIEVLHARSEVALAGRLARVPVLDQVVVRFSDHERFEREAGEARALGYAGKMCIHPSQVALAHTAFTPAPAEVAAALAVIDAYEAAEKNGKGGVIVVDGRMIDGPLVAQARRVVEMAD